MSEIDEDVMKRARECFIRCGNTPDSLIAGIYRALAEAKREERERCAAVVDDFQYSADATFNDLIARNRKGEMHLELAAATAAGMSHQARKAAAAIRKGGDHDQS